MTDVGANAQILLRAEIRSSKETIVACAREVTTSAVFVVTDWLPPEGTDVELALSLPTLLEPVHVRARVVGHRHSHGVGESAGVELALVFADEDARARFAGVVQRLALDPSHQEPRIYRVLLVEDNAFIRDMFAFGIDKFFRQRRGQLRLDHVEDAAAAWKCLARATFDLVIVDYYLPAEDGAALIARIRGDARLARVPVVAISVGGRDAREATLSAGADLFLDKPVVLRDLWGTLQLLSAKGGIA